MFFEDKWGRRISLLKINTFAQVQLSKEILALFHQRFIRQQHGDFLPSFLLNNCDNKSAPCSLGDTLLALKFLSSTEKQIHIFNPLLKLVSVSVHHPVCLELPECFNEFTAMLSVILKCLLAVDRLFVLQNTEADCTEKSLKKSADLFLALICSFIQTVDT